LAKVFGMLPTGISLSYMVRAREKSLICAPVMENCRLAKRTGSAVIRRPAPRSDCDRLYDRLLPSDLPGVAPKQFQVVDSSVQWVEQVDYEVAEIENHPAARLVSVLAHGALTKFLHLAKYIIGDGANLAIVASRRDDEEVGQIGELAQVENANVLSLLAVGYPGADCRQGF
jgi:hypothetical protein